MSDEVIRTPPEKDVGYVHRLGLTKDAVSAAYHCMVNTKVKKSTRKNHSRVMKALKRSAKDTQSCMYPAPDEDTRLRRGEWLFREGVLKLTTDAFDYLKESTDKILNGEGVDGQFGEGYDDLCETMDSSDIERKAKEKKDEEDKKGSK